VLLFVVAGKIAISLNGFLILRRSGHWNKEALTASSPTIVTICTRSIDVQSKG